jgi:hypothetical protein
MRFFEEAQRLELPRNPITGVVQGAMLAGITSVYYELLSGARDPSENTQFVINTWLCCLSAGFAIGAMRYGFDYLCPRNR